MAKIELDDCVRRKDQLLTRRVSENQILLDLDSGEYYGLDEVGARVWELCDGTRRVSEVVSIICNEYNAPVDTVQADVLELLQDLAREKLVVSSD